MEEKRPERRGADRQYLIEARNVLNPERRPGRRSGGARRREGDHAISLRRHPWASSTTTVAWRCTAPSSRWCSAT